MTFVWTYTPNAPATETFTGAVSGTDANSGAASSSPPPASPPPVDVSQPATLVASLTMTPPFQVRVGQLETAAVLVRNTGQNDLTVTAISRAIVDPAGHFGPASAIAPVLPFTILGGGSTVFSWTYLGALCGSIPAQISTSVFGADAVTGTVLASSMLVSGPLTAASSATTMVVSVLQPRVKVATISNLTVTVYDSCTPKVAVANEVITLAVVTGGGKIVYISGPTDGLGSMQAIVLTGNVPGQNAYLVSDPNLAGTTVFVEGTVPDVPTPFLSKNFFDPGRGEKLQVRVTEPRALHLSVRVYNLAAELVRVIKDEDVQAGLTVWEWDGRNSNGATVGNGTYFIQVVSGNDTQIKKVIVLKR